MALMILPFFLQAATTPPVAIQPATVDTVSLGTWLIGGLLSLIAALIVYIWQDNKTQASDKHKDIVALISRLDLRQTALEDEQKAQKFQIVALNGAINVIQGKPYNYDNTTLQ